jgi:hypothetical protein
MEELKFKVGPGGVIETVYTDNLENLSDMMSASMVRVCRASHVEWEKGEPGFSMDGWVIRAAHDPSLFIRYDGKGDDNPNPFIVSREGHPMHFPTRHRALEVEVLMFWKLLPPKEKSDGG